MLVKKITSFLRKADYLKVLIIQQILNIINVQYKFFTMFIDERRNYMRRMSIGTLLMALFIPLIVGAISALLSSQGMATYGSMSKPPLSPPAWVFSVAWTILYLMMGLASYFIMMANDDSGEKSMAIALYAVQLVMNFMWSIMFFNWGFYLVSFIWLIIMWAIVILCAVRFYSINKAATYLFIPYILWLTFAAYLNMGAYVLSMKNN